MNDEELNLLAYNEVSHFNQLWIQSNLSSDFDQKLWIDESMEYILFIYIFFNNSAILHYINVID